MIELLVVKAGDQYYRFSEEDCLAGDLSRASVYPLNRVDEVKLLCAGLQEAGVAAEVKKLIVTEESYVE